MMSPEFLYDDGRIAYATLDLGVYSLGSVLKTAHRYTGRCFVHLQLEGDSRVGLRLRVKGGGDPCPVAGSFCNDLLDEVVRERVASETQGVRNLILAHALSGSSLLHPELEEEEQAT